MKSRLIASLALGALVVLGTSGCSMISVQATTLQYSPSDGVNIPDSGPLEVRNVLIVADEEGNDGNLVAAIVNATSDSQTLRIEFGEGSAKSTESIRVPANTTVSLGTEETEPLLLEGIDTKPGSDLPMYFQSGDADGILFTVPVLDDSLDYLAGLAP
ncbi:DNA modification methylase [Microbacterium sp. zg.B48]|uniref:DNA modification methylase n=1 Tax=unclassified Microbacterium TaxID=2609290 RepID=UPI00214BF78C|nr:MULTISPECIES: DNA modification methylase [unclassified Microbacterium]MCR2762567.1 DNA modification methylase [Microbacterium sp. zg.B48]MCR2810737.1 DNA modification methylase [Microbacterium sp. zg.B185]WIM18272.1 DNA modification methylase [Microbacterium sp. zg-B185]